ncbi:MAG: hypothetical protein GX854_13540, partial [Clostridiales bacterium]|nr:hypothetical protein [Clostridiales bacterium]
MDQYIMALNSGSSSLKFNLFKRAENNTLYSILSGIVEEVGNPEKSQLKFDLDGKRHRVSLPVESHRKALIILFQELEKNCIPMESIVGVG